ncbi:MAG: hypothetical protein M1834_009056 [Cirrosporium novae-zelandiae]|nr:MAG: hypothetical protein M1834_009056 [Cirrosporium novae-zelandiae]
MSYTGPFPTASPTASTFPTSLPIDPNAPPPPPPKPSSHETSRLGTPQAGPPLPPPPPIEQSSQSNRNSQYADQISESTTPAPSPLPEEGWVPEILKDKSILDALIHAPSTTHPTATASQQSAEAALEANIEFANTLANLHNHLVHMRSQTETQLLNVHALERAWRTKQAEVDAALAPFSAKSLYQRLVASVGEQESVCHALEESFFEGEGKAGEREVEAWTKRFREERKLVHLRKERKDRWDEGRVGGWR